MTAPRARLPGRYVNPTLIAHGGMGDVYRATDETLHRTVAIKLLGERFAADDSFRARFVREARTAASLSSEPFVIAIHDVGETADGRPFIVMEYAPGGTVADRLRAGDVPLGQALDWLEQAAVALDRAHAGGVVHRDVKPANLLLAEDETVRVSDFGIARAAGQDTLTAVGTVLGSAGYMAPEQARGEPITSATDRYALACVAFELLTGRRPFARDSAAAELAAHSNEPPPSVLDLQPSLPHAVDGVVLRGLAKSPEDRPHSAEAFMAELRDALRGPPTLVETLPTTAAPTAVVRHAARPRYGVVLLVAAALAGAGGLFGWLLTSTSGAPPRQVVVERTVTERTTTTMPTTPTTEADGEDPGALNDQGFRLLQQGEAAQALPLLEEAVAELRGTESLTEAFASYNLAWARLAVGRCDGVEELLERSQDIQGERTEIDRLRDDLERRCEGGEGREGRGKGKGKKED